MSESQTQSYQPTKSAPRKGSVWVWFVALLVAIAALSGAVAYAGGVGAVAKMLGLGDIRLPSLSGLHLPSFGNSSYGNSASNQPSPNQTAVTTVTAPATGKNATGTLSPEVLSRMYNTQVLSRQELADLVVWRIGKISLGKVTSTDDSATIPVTATYAGGNRRRGFVTLAKYSGTWYLFGFEPAPGSGSTPETIPQTIDPAVVRAITDQQAQAGTQSLIVNGLLGGGFTEITVIGVHAGPRTATADVVLSGGTGP